MYTDIEKQEIFLNKLKQNQPWMWNEYVKLIANEKLSRDELHVLNLSKRLEIMRYAYEHTIFYRRVYDAAGVNPGDVKNDDDWNKLPIVTKQMLRDYFEEWKVDAGKSSLFKGHAVPLTSGGSTGKPVKFYVDTIENGSTAQFAEWRTIGWYTGRTIGSLFSEIPHIGQNEAWFVRMSCYKLLKNKAARNEIARQLFPTERMYLDVLDMNQDMIRDFTEEANQKGVFYIAGYTGALEEIARYYNANAIKRAYRPTLITVRSSVLTSSAREIIEKGFDCPVCDNYCTNEFYHIAFESPHSNHNLHVLSDLRHVDIVDSHGKALDVGERGTVCCTDFMNHIFPFVRYSLGDQSHFVDSSKSVLPFPMIAPVYGRETDYLEDKNGNRIYGLCCTFDDHPNCAHLYQYVQHAPGKATLRVVPNRDYANWEAEVRKIVNEIQSSAGNRIDYSLEYVDDIPHDGGKIRFIVYE